jgi:hypothetical protein
LLQRAESLDGPWTTLQRERYFVYPSGAYYDADVVNNTTYYYRVFSIRGVEESLPAVFDPITPHNS